MKNIHSAGFGGYQEFLIGHVRRWRFVCHKGQLEVVDDALGLLLDNRPEEAVLSFEAALILRKESLEMMDFFSAVFLFNLLY